MTIGFKYTEQKKQVTKSEKWTTEEKAEYVAKVKKWRSELKRYEDFNVYYHPDLPTKPYRKKYVDGYFKMVPWKIFGDKISVGKDGETYKIKISELENHNDGFEVVGPGSWSKNDIQPTTFQAEVPLSLKSEFDAWLTRKTFKPEEIQSPF